MKTLANIFLVKLNLRSPSASCLPNTILALDLKLLETPHRGYEKLRAAYTHDGRLSDFVCHLELSKNKQNIIGDLQFTVQPFILSIQLTSLLLVKCFEARSKIVKRS
jgi:hypothetical protein